MKKDQHIFALTVLFIIGVTACEKEVVYPDETAYGTIVATPSQTQQLIPDGGGATFYITQSRIGNQELINGQRVIANYTLLKNVTPENLADHVMWNIRLNEISELPTKSPIFMSQVPEPDDELGTDAIIPLSQRITSRYFTLRLELPSASSLGNLSINLWIDDSEPASEVLTVVLHCKNIAAGSINVQTDISFDLGDLLYKDGHFKNKLHLRYSESSGLQKELRYRIERREHGPYLVPE